MGKIPELKGDSSAASTLLVGHSHRYALWEARRSVSAPLCMVDNGSANPDDQDETFWDAAIQAASGRPVAMVWKGNQAFRHVFRSVTQRSVLPLDLESDRHRDDLYIPFELAQAWVSEHSELSAASALLLRFIAVASAMVLVGTPPPKSSEHIRAAFQSVDYEAPALAEWKQDAAFEIAHLSTRVAFWQATQEVLSELADKVGVPFVPVPEGVVAEDGSLKPEFCAPDVSHANQAYGERILHCVLSRLADAPVPRAA